MAQTQKQNNLIKKREAVLAFQKKYWGQRAKIKHIKSIDTNLGLFRAYITIYLQNHPFVAQDAFLLVNELEPTPQGIPIRIYCYTTVTDWVSHESVQSEIFEHLALMAPRFELDLYQIIQDSTTHTSHI